MSLNKEKQKVVGMNKAKKRLIFSIVVLALPILQFLIFYIYVNFNSILMAFQKFKINSESLGYKVSFAGLENIVVASKFFVKNLWMVKNSLVLYLIQLFIGITLALLFSYYIYKKRFGAGIFNVILFMPQILSSVVLALLFKYLVTNAYPQIANNLFGLKLEGLLDNPKTKLGTVFFYNIWVGFGVNVLLFSGAMSGINESIVESAKLDGAGAVREFFSITLPLIWSTFVTFIIVGFAGIFTNQMHLFTLFGSSGNELSTLGYYMYINVLNGSITSVSDKYLNYSQLSSLGLICTFIVLPLTLLFKKALIKWGPEV